MSNETLSPGVWRLPATLSDDLSLVEKNVAQFKSGAISPTQFQVFRVPQGVYEQRESGTYMLRVRFPAGVALPGQLRKLAEVSRQFGNGVLHLTTRQDIQVHRVSVDALHPALRSLAEAGLSTKGGGGNTVRNITGCPYAGVCAREVFDVTPFVLGLTEYLLPDPHSFQLPRKYKIAVSGCSADTAGATINDVGLIAKERDGKKGFAVYVGGGLGSGSRVGSLLEEFVPVEEAPWVVEAIKRVFDARGNRKDRRQARLRFLIAQLGLEPFRQLYLEQLAQLRAQGSRPPAAREIPEAFSAPTTGHARPRGSAAFEAWYAASTAPQKQAGFHRVELPLPLGDISADRLEDLAEVVGRFGERQLRVTQKQNFNLRWVASEELIELHRALSAIGLASVQPPVLRDLVTCTGAANCRLGICLSRGLAAAVTERLSKVSVDLHALGPVQINISGCPNSCGRHQIADIGLYGAARRVDGRLVPHYAVQLGGRVAEGKTELASGRLVVPARSVPAFLADLLEAYAQSPQKPDFHAFAQASGALLDELGARYSKVPAFQDDRNYYYDWSANELFSLAGRGPGECGAGVLDLIEVDLKSAAEALAGGRLFQAAVLSARALLVTRGEQANTDRDAFVLFQKLFIDAGLVGQQVQPIVSKGLAVAGSPGAASAFGEKKEAVAQFVGAIQELFKSMDATLQFPKRQAAPVSAALAAVPGLTKEKDQVDVEKDFRGVVCPLNYVKTKMALAPMKVGQVLSVLLDEQGARNVPESAEKDGQEVLLIERENEHWRLILRKRR